MLYRFDKFTLDSGQYQLFRAGEPVQVEPQVFDLLLYLVENHDRLVSREELLDELWKDRVVTDNALNARLKAARKAVDDSGDEQTVIKTVHGRGYRFVAGVEAEQDPSRDGAGSPPVAAASLELPDKPSIAVLPFANISDDPSQQIFCDGLTEDVITELSRFRDLFVIASNSCFTYKGRAVRIQQVSEELGVQYVLEGSVQRAGDRVRISVQLIDGPSGSHLWTQRYDREMDDVFAIQDELTEQIVGTLASGYGGRIRRAWLSRPKDRQAGKAQAFDLFTSGIAYTDLWTPAGLEQARRCFEQALELDPGNARAVSKLAWCYLIGFMEGWSDDPVATLERGYEIARQGLSLDDNESWVYWPIGAYHVFKGEHRLGIEAFENALRLNPNDADVLADFGYFLSFAGEPERALELMLRAIRLNPHHPDWYMSELEQVFFDCRRYEDAIAAFGRIRSNQTGPGLVYLAASYAALGRDADAATAVQRVLVYDPAACIEKWCDPMRSPYRRAEDLAHLRDNLTAAGLPARAPGAGG